MMVECWIGGVAFERRVLDDVYAYTQDHKGGGIVHFRTRDDMDYALRKLDGSDFRNPFEKSRISVSTRLFAALVWLRESRPV